jgi:hypothetical protein
VRFNKGLLEAVSMLLSLYVFISHFLVFETLLLPIKLKVDVSGNSGHRQIPVSQFHYFAQDVFVTNSSQLRVLLEISCNHFISELCQSFNFVGWERVFVLLFRLCNSLCNVPIVKDSFLLGFLSLLLGGLP